MSRARRIAETVLRAGAFAVLAYAIWSVSQRTRTVGAAALSETSIESRLAGMMFELPRPLHVETEAAFSPVERDWLAAFDRSGWAVSWSSPALAPLALSVESLADPHGGWVAGYASGRNDSIPLVLSDSIGVLDTIPPGRQGGTVRIPAAASLLRIEGGGTSAFASLPGQHAPKPALVMGTAGWELRFVVDALEGRGWEVHSLAEVAPGVSVTRGSLRPVDTSSYAVVIVVDSTATAEADRIVRFTRSGGGLVLLGTAASVPAYRGLAPGETGTLRRGRVFITGEPERDDFAYHPIVQLKGDAIVLERRANDVVAAARREGAGRVLQLGDDEAWRWRLSGGEGGVELHRSWLAAVVGDVAPRRPDYSHRAFADNRAPVANMARVLGPPASPPAHPGDARLRIPLVFLISMILLLLLLEWGSRRSRGAA